ncbi:MAG: alpha/beta hydrolase [Clostridia bacterium]|nr:alpha/beta hydrolase [Clostridia bacterium]
MSFLSTFFSIDDLIKHKGANCLNYPNVTEINDIVYSDSIPEVCKLDLLFDKSQLPESGKFPVVFNIHGGGWITGDKRFRRGVSLQFANAGNAVVNVNYALTPKYTYKDEVQNIFSALKWVREHADEYNLDLNKMVITGDSAGAHLSVVTLVTLKDTNWQQKFEVEPLDVDFKGAMLFCGPYDFDEFWMRFPVLDTMLKGIAGVKRKKDVKNSPYADYLNPIPAIDGTFPKSLVIMGMKDFVTNPHSRKLMKKFDEIGVPYEQFMAKHFFNCFHCFHLKIWMPAAKKAMAKAISFASEVLA